MTMEDVKTVSSVMQSTADPYNPNLDTIGGFITAVEEMFSLTCLKNNIIYINSVDNNLSYFTFIQELKR